MRSWFAELDVVMNPRIDVPKGVLANPTIKMSIARHNNSIIPAFRKQLPKRIKALLSGIRFPDRIIATAQKADLHPGESLHIFWGYQVSKLRLVTADVIRKHCAHSREVGQEVHVNAVKELVQPGMRCAVEVSMGPAATEGKVTAMADS